MVTIDECRSAYFDSVGQVLFVLSNILFVKEDAEGVWSFRISKIATVA